MKRFLLSSILLTGTAFAAEAPRHMISFSSAGLGWSSSVEKMTTKSKSEFDELMDFKNNFALNYAYRITDQQQLGFFVRFEHTELEFDKRQGGVSRSENETNAFGLFVIHNFSTDLKDSYFVGLSYSLANLEEEVSHDFADAEGKAPIETDDVVTSYEAVFGKRFSLKNWNIDNLVYSPQLNVFYRTHSKDFDDQGVKYGLGAAIQPIKFDLLF